MPNKVAALADGERVPYPVSFKLPKELIRALDGIAVKDRRSRNAVVNRALCAFVVKRQPRARRAK